MIIRKHNDIKLDSSGKLFLRKKERENFDKEIIVIVDGNSLLFMTKEEWNQTVKKELRGLRGKDFRKRQRLLFSSAYNQAIDQQGRILVPRQFRRNLKKGGNTCLRLWRFRLSRLTGLCRR